MRVVAVLSGLLLAVCAASAQAQTPLSDRAQRWTDHVAALSSDAMEGRAAGTAGHVRAEDYVIAQMTRLGLEPAGTDGWRQPIAFTEQTVDSAGSSGTLTVGGEATPISFTRDMALSGALELPGNVDAELVFVGYGLHMPTSGYSDLDGVDLNGKIAVFLANGAPAGMPDLTLTHARAQRNRLLAERGAVGAITLVPPADDPARFWAGVMRGTTRPGLYFTEARVRAIPTPFASIVLNPDRIEGLFAASGRDFGQVIATAEASGRLTSFPMNARLTARLAATTTSMTSSNVIGRLPGSDPAMADEHVVLTSHLDGYGVGAPVNGDAIYNGALDNASGVAAQLDIAEQLIALKPRRTILFVIVTAEEKGLLGSRYFVGAPTVPRESVVANLNYDMALSIIPLTGVNVLGATESTIGDHARAVSAEMGLPLTPDPFPAENRFIRSDQYSFIAEGIPAVAFKFGFTAGTPEATTIATFNRTRYHQPSDDMTQPVFAEDEIRLHDFIVALALRVANDPARPTWNADSIFGK